MTNNGLGRHSVGGGSVSGCGGREGSVVRDGRGVWPSVRGKGAVACDLSAVQQ